MVAELVVIRVVEKQLSDDEIGSGTDFLLQVTPIRIFAILTGNVAFREASNADAKIALFSNKPDQLMRKLKPTRGDLELAPTGRVAAQCQDILNTQAANLVQQIFDLLACGTNAG